MEVEPHPPRIVAVDGRELEGRPTGIGRWLGGLLRSWAAAAGPERFVVFHREPPAAVLSAAPRIEARTLRPGLLGAGTGWYEQRFGRALAWLRPDVLFGPQEALPWTWHGASLVVFHDLACFARPHDFSRSEGLRRRAYARLAARRARRLVAVSAFTRGELSRRLAVEAGRIEVVEPGVDATLLTTRPTPEAELRGRIGAPGPFALVVGSLLERRRTDEVVEAFARLDTVDLALVIVGDDRRRAGAFAGLAERAEALGVRDRVRWLGYATDADLAALYRAAHHMICVSDYEGFGLPALEAMAFGLPVVVSGGGALGELHGAAALTIERNDAACIARAVRRVIEEPGLRDTLRARGFEAARRRDGRRSAARLLDLLRETPEHRR